jgi:Uma2 family endonuclease
MIPVPKTPIEPETEFEDRIRFSGVAWEDYERLLAMRGESAVPRITYLDGEVELMVPGQPHEFTKKTVARLLEAWADARRVPLTGYGSWTLRNKRRKGGLEPDECYVLGIARKRRPDLAIEVVWTSGGIDKLEVYRRLGVGEVWFWRRGVIAVHVLEREAYRQVERSLLLPDLDLQQLTHFAAREDQPHAVWDYRKELGGAGPR